MRRTSTGLFALLVVGGVYAWRNRFQIQEFLDNRNIKLPFNTKDVTDRLRSGVSKITNRVEESRNQVLSQSSHQSQPTKKAV